LLSYGVGCVTLNLYERRSVNIFSPGLFAGVGSSIILTDDGETWIIWDGQRIWDHALS